MDKGEGNSRVRDLTVIYACPPGAGWDPVTLMARQVAALFDATYVEIIDDKVYTRARALTGFIPRRRGRRTCLVIAAQPVHLTRLLSRDYLVHGYEHVVGWVIDSFLDDRIPHMARGRGHLDELFITDGELIDDWARATATPTAWLPWGADVMAMGPMAVTDRPDDLRRVGRQPEEWDNDEDVAAAARLIGVTYRGRPGFGEGPDASQQSLVAALTRVKFALAFSNKHSPADYTHRSREYLTGRWTMALGAGASVAGIAPRCRATDELLWEGALLELGTVDRSVGLGLVRDAVAAWTPQTAIKNRLEALRRLDWRWRYERLAEALVVEPPALSDELHALRARILETEELIG